MLGTHALGTIALGIRQAGATGAMSPVSARLASGWCLRGSPVVARHLAPSADLLPLSARHAAPSGQMLPLSARHAAPSGQMIRLSQRHRSASALRSDARARHVAVSAIQARALAAARHRAVASMPDESAVIIPGNSYLVRP